MINNNDELGVWEFIDIDEWLKIAMYRDINI